MQEDEQPESKPFKATMPTQSFTPLTDNEIIEKATRSKNGVEFPSLWRGDTSKYNGDESRADLALCNILAFWSGCDSSTIDRLFRQSGLMREKWDRKTGGTTYGEITIQKAINDCTETYNPNRKAETAMQDFSESINAGNTVTQDIQLQPFTYEDMKKYKACLLYTSPSPRDAQ